MCSPSVPLFLIFGFFGLKGWVASPKIGIFEFSAFLVFLPVSSAPKIGNFEILVFWVCPQVVWPQKSEFSKFELFGLNWRGFY